MKTILQNGTFHKLLIGGLGAAFGAGVTLAAWTGQISNNSKRIDCLEPKVEDVQARMIRVEEKLNSLVSGQDRIEALIRADRKLPR